MCGIVGYVGRKAVREVLLTGLEKLEYRGYDSAGISLLTDDGRIESVRAVGNLSRLRAAIDHPDDGAVATVVAEGSTGIGHTRWATHGRVTWENAHPHYDTTDRVHVVVNGIVENYMALKTRLITEGAIFTSETDAEVIAHLVAHHYDGDLATAVRLAYNELDGHYAFVAMHADHPDVLVGARKECPLIVGRGAEETFLASAIPAFLAHTRAVQYIENGELVVVRPDGVDFLAARDGAPVERPVEHVDWDAEAAEKGGYETFTLKEIHEQPHALAETVADRTIRDDGVDLGDLGGIDDALLATCSRMTIVSCGTSYHAGMVGRYALEEWARVPVDMDIASEYRYRNPVVGPGDLVIGISQSGETADTLAALRVARERGAKVLAITNVMGSQMTREADGVLYTRAGIEIGVAATKTFVSQVATCLLFALRVAELRGTLPRERRRALVTEIKHLAHYAEEAIRMSEDAVEELAERYHAAGFFLYLGRHVGLAVALEGALKLKELSYIATDAYAAGEMKHGPIALLSERTPVVAVANDMPILDKMVSNMQEVRARGAHIIAVVTEGDTVATPHCDHVLPVPRTDWTIQPVLAVIPLQILAYKIALKRGLNIDQPRNLAKTVTVE